jgi:hypothetical protein
MLIISQPPAMEKQANGINPKARSPVSNSSRTLQSTQQR